WAATRNLLVKGSERCFLFNLKERFELKTPVCKLYQRFGWILNQVQPAPTFFSGNDVVWGAG
ncbi:MAG TPA: hypothetical protein VKA34_08635, partial [Balneolales bacterium]|nr:hypothetical protein [Balneolales bacterium]